jgi:hypothetical protein
VGGRAAERRRRAAVVRYWRAVELFSPPKVDPVNAEKDMYPVEVGRPLPWEPEHAIGRKRLRRGWVWQHTVYAGVFDIERMREVLRQVFGTDERDQDFDGRHAGDSALLSFTVNQDGLLLMESPMLSSCAWAVGRALSPGPRDSTWLDGFEEDSEQCLGRLTQLADGRLSAVVAAAGAGGISRSVLGAIAGVAANVVLGAATGGVGVLGSAASTALGSVWGPMAAGAIQKSGDGIAEAAVGKAKDAALRHAGAVPKAAADDATDPDGKPPALLGSVPLDVRGMAAVVRWVAGELGVADALVPDAIRVKSYQVHASRAEEADQQDFLNSFIAEDLARVAQSLASGTSGRALEEYLRHDSTSARSARIDVRQQPRVLLEGVRPSAAPLGRWPANPQHPLVLSQQFAVNTALAEFGGDNARGVYAVNGPPGTGKTTMLRDLVAALVVRRAERLATLRRAWDAFGAPVEWTADGRKRTVHPPIPELTGFEMVIASANNGAVENVTTEIPAADAIHEDWQASADYLSQPASLLLGAPAWGAVAARLGNRGNRTEFKERFFWGEEKPTRIPSQRATAKQRTGQGLHDLLRRAHDLQRGVDSAAGAELTAPLGTYSWDEARRRFTQARDKVQQLATQRHKAVQALGRLAQAEARLQAAHAAADAARQDYSAAEEALRLLQTAANDSEDALARAEAELQTAHTGLVQARRDTALAQDVCAVAVTELTAFDRRKAPGWWRRTFFPKWVERWHLERQPYAEAVRSREAAWQLLFLIVPVVSTTFASLDRMFTGLDAESLGWLFVDEAGQATPQQVVGALWRARRAVVVGDPLQLEPVVTLPWTAQQKLREHFGVAEEWAPGRTSVQRLSDRLARYGTELPGPDGSPVWVGSPLRVHRRCDRLMFDVSNAIAYDQMMVFGTGDREEYPTVNRSIWLHVEAAEADGKWIPQEGRALAHCLDLIADRLHRTLLDERATTMTGIAPAPEWDVPEGDEDPLEAELRRRLAQTVFVVSPFRDVVRGAQRTAGNLLPKKEKRVGTVHTTQGKEADVVILVLGTKPDQNGSRNWATLTPNLLNVAVSRARRRLIVIGNHTTWSRHHYFSTLANHPDLHLKNSSEWLSR